MSKKSSEVISGHFLSTCISFYMVLTLSIVALILKLTDLISPNGIPSKPLPCSGRAVSPGSYNAGSPKLQLWGGVYLAKKPGRELSTTCHLTMSTRTAILREGGTFSVVLAVKRDSWEMRPPLLSVLLWAELCPYPRPKSHMWSSDP